MFRKGFLLPPVESYARPIILISIPLPHDRKERKPEYNARTSAERVNNREKPDSQLFSFSASF